MKLFRLKKEAVQFFKEGLANCLYGLDTWKKLQVDMNALEEVEEAYLQYGQKTSEHGATLGGWSEDGSKFHFTVHFPSMKYCEHDKFSKGRMIRDLSGRIQGVINNFYMNFSTETEVSQ